MLTGMWRVLWEKEEVASEPDRVGSVPGAAATWKVS